MPQLVELTWPQCLSVLFHGVVGRVGFNTPTGPRIALVNYSIDGDDIIMRTSPYSELGTYGSNRIVALEVEELDAEKSQGWSVVATGRCDTIDSPVLLSKIRGTCDSAWASGSRHVYLRLAWDDLSGHRMPRGQVHRLLSHAA